MRPYWESVVLLGVWSCVVIVGCSPPTSTTLSQRSMGSDRWYHWKITATTESDGEYTIVTEDPSQYTIDVTSGGTTTTYHGSGSLPVTDVAVSSGDVVTFTWSTGQKKKITLA